MPYLLVLLFAAAQAGGDFRVKGGVSSGTNESVYETKNSQGRVVDRTKIVTATTTLSMELVPLTAEEKRLRDENLQRLGASLAIFAMLPSHFEVMYAPQRDDGRLHGIRAALYPVAYGIGRHYEIAVGYAGARFKAEYADPDTGTMRVIKYRLRAIAARFGVAPVRWFVATIEIQPNLLDLDDSDGRYGATVRGTATVSIPKIDRFYGKLGTERLGLGASGRWSTFVEAGMRF